MIGAVNALFKGFSLTFRYIFRRGITQQYPEVRREVSPGYRGMPALRKYEETGKERCVACCLCVQICPAQCIVMETGTGEDGLKYPVGYEMEVGRCLYCGLCEEVCPVEAVILSGEYELAPGLREGATLDKEELLNRGEGI